MPARKFIIIDNSSAGYQYQIICPKCKYSKLTNDIQYCSLRCDGCNITLNNPNHIHGHKICKTASERKQIINDISMKLEKYKEKYAAYEYYYSCER